MSSEVNGSTNKKTFVCKLCLKSFGSKFNLQRHVDRKYPCNQNNIVYPIRTNKKTFVCKLCLKSFGSKFNLQRHVDRKYPCNQNNIVYPIRNNINNDAQENSITNENVISENNTNIQVYVPIIEDELIEFQDENIECIDEEIMESTKMGYNAAYQLVQLVHFNDKYPCYRNVYLDRRDTANGYFYNGDNWEHINKKKLVSLIYKRKFDILKSANANEIFKAEIDQNLIEHEKESYNEFISMSQEQMEKHFKDMEFDKKIELALVQGKAKAKAFFKKLQKNNL